MLACRIHRHDRWLSKVAASGGPSSAGTTSSCNRCGSGQRSARSVGASYHRETVARPNIKGLTAPLWHQSAHCIIHAREDREGRPAGLWIALVRVIHTPGGSSSGRFQSVAILRRNRSKTTTARFWLRGECVPDASFDPTGHATTAACQGYLVTAQSTALADPGMYVTRRASHTVPPTLIHKRAPCDGKGALFGVVAVLNLQDRATLRFSVVRHGTCFSYLPF